MKTLIGLEEWLLVNEISLGDFAYYTNLSPMLLQSIIKGRFNGSLLAALKVYFATGGEVDFETILSPYYWDELLYLLHNHLRLSSYNRQKKLYELCEERGIAEQEIYERLKCFREYDLGIPGWRLSRRKDMALTEDFPWTLCNEKGEIIPETLEEKEERFSNDISHHKYSLGRWKVFSQDGKSYLPSHETPNSLEALKSYRSFYKKTWEARGFYPLV